MHIRGLEEFIRYIKGRAYNLDKRYAKGNNTVKVSVYFMNTNHKTAVILLQDRKSLFKIERKIIFHNPEIVEVEIITNGIKERHKYNYNTSPHFVNENNDNRNETFNERHGKANEKGNENNDNSGFEAQRAEYIESIVSKRLEEVRRERELNELRIELEQKDKILAKTDNEIELLESKVKEQNKKIAELHRTIESNNKLEG